jgi:WD40 repeat protein
MEYKCPAVDINEIHFHPLGDHYISAGCTDGIIYVWDVRMPEYLPATQTGQGPPFLLMLHFPLQTTSAIP